MTRADLLYIHALCASASIACCLANRSALLIAVRQERLRIRLEAK